jgi:hypothetical protein
MGLSQPQTIFGVHSVTLFDRASKLPFGIIKIVGSISANFSGDFVDLFGGSNRYAWDSEAGNLDVTIEGTVKETPNMLFEKFLGGTATQNAAEASGNVGTLTNKRGELVEATTGIASASALSGSEDDLKDAQYVVLAVSATEVDVYAMTDVDFNNGSPLSFEDDSLKITATPLTIPDSGGVVTIPNTGIELTGGSGTVALTTGDTAYVYSRKINAGSDIITLGQALQEFPEFGVKIASQRKAGGDTFQSEFYRCKGIGLPLNMSEKEWSESDITIKALYDACEDGIGQIRRIRSNSGTC